MAGIVSLKTPTSLCWYPKDTASRIRLSEHQRVLCSNMRSRPTDWADVTGVNLVRDPQGMLLGEALEMVTTRGWSDADGRTYRPNTAFELRDLILCIERGVSRITAKKWRVLSREHLKAGIGMRSSRARAQRCLTWLSQVRSQF